MLEEKLELLVSEMTQIKNILSQLLELKKDPTPASSAVVQPVKTKKEEPEKKEPVKTKKEEPELSVDGKRQYIQQLCADVCRVNRKDRPKIVTLLKTFDCKLISELQDHDLDSVVAGLILIVSGQD